MKKQDQLLRPSSIPELILINMLDRGMVTSQMFEMMYSSIENNPLVKKILKNSSFEDEIKQYGLDDVGLNYKKSKNTVFKRKKTQYNKNVDNLQA
tara:strand:- start:328 stop:612 length:285 start_codon:yes stop_codon:yes gene_type:complete